MDITVYLPDEIGARAKRDGVKLSGMLRSALEDYFEERDTVAETLKSAKEFVVDVEDRSGRRYKGRFTGTEVASSERGTTVYLTEDERLLLVDVEDHLYEWDEAETTLEDFLGGNQDLYLDVAAAIGEEPIIDI